MKRILISITTAILMIASFSSYAAEKTNPLKGFNSLKIISTYLNATALGNHEFNEHLFAKDFEYQNIANDNRFTKKEYIKFLKANKGLQYNCKTSHRILDETGDSCLAKATMEFENFTRIDYITLRRTNDTWEVSKVVTTYP